MKLRPARSPDGADDDVLLIVVGVGATEPVQRVGVDRAHGADITPEWGLHLVDANVAMGDLVRLAGSQARAYRRR